jgi:hypothetical protein
MKGHTDLLSATRHDRFSVVVMLPNLFRANRRLLFSDSVHHPEDPLIRSLTSFLPVQFSGLPHHF